MDNTTSDMLTTQMDAQASQFDAIFTETETYDSLYEVPLEITVRRQIVVLLCTGGPHVEAVANLAQNGTVTDARIFGCWGSANETRRVSGGSALWRALEEYAVNIVNG